MHSGNRNVLVLRLLMETPAMHSDSLKTNAIAGGARAGATPKRTAHRMLKLNAQLQRASKACRLCKLLNQAVCRACSNLVVVAILVALVST